MAIRKDHPQTEQAQKCPDCKKMTYQWSASQNCWICHNCGYTDQYSKEPAQKGRA